MPILKLTNSTIRAIVDPEDIDAVKHIRWSQTNNYIQGWSGKAHVYLHRLIAGAKPGDEVQFRNRIRHDCRRANLILTTRQRNTNRRRQTSTGLPGIRFIHESFSVRLVLQDGTRVYIGTFQTRDEAEENKPQRGYIQRKRPHYRVHHPISNEYLGMADSIEEAQQLQRTGKKKRRCMTP